MILLIPYTRFTIKTHLSAYEAEQQLAAQVEPRKLFGWPFSRNHKFFTGSVKNGGFKIYRIIHYRNSFLPTIVGQIHDDLHKCRIEVTMRLSNLIVGFIALCITIWASMGYIIFSVLPETDKNIIIFCGFLILFYGISMAFFNYEANKARRHLEEIFQADTFNN
jgi:hypothetical protein